MELQILLAGVEFGPYTVDQARELLGEGFLSATDPAKRIDESDWLPLSEILSQMPARAPEEPAQEISAEPEPEVTEPKTEAPPEEESHGDVFTSETPATFESVEESETETAESETPTSESTNISDESVEIPTRVSAEEYAPVEAAAPKYETPFISPQRIAAAAAPPGSKAIEMKTPSFSGAAPTPIVSRTPLLQVSVPNKAKNAMRTGSLLAQDALRAARERSGILSPIGRTAAKVSAPPEPPVVPSAPEPEPAEPPAPRRKLQLNMGHREESEPEPLAPPTAPRKAIRLTGRISLPGLAPKPELAQGQPGSLTGSGPLIISRPSRTGGALRTSTRPLTAKERSSFLIGKITRPGGVAKEEVAEAPPTPALEPVETPETFTSEENKIEEAPTPPLENEPGSPEALVHAAGEETVAEEPLTEESAPGTVNALLDAAGTETVAGATDTDSGPLPEQHETETATESDLTASGNLTTTGDLAEKRSLKITGPLRHPTPHIPIRLGSVPKTSESSRLPYSTGDRPPTSALPLPEVPPELPPSPASEESLPHRPETGKIPVSAMPNEGVRIRARRLTTKVTLPEKEKPIPVSTVPPLPEPIPLPSVQKEAPASPTSPAVESVQAEVAVSAAPPSSSATAETTALPAEAAATSELPPPSKEASETASLARPDKVRLRRPVKLELSSRAKIQESGRLTLEAFSKMASLELPGKATAAKAATSPTAKLSAPIIKETPPEKPAADESGVHSESVAASSPSPDDYYPQRLVEAPPLAWKSTQMKTPRHWEWLAYLIITFGVMAFCFIIYRWSHHEVPGTVEAPVLTSKSSTNAAGTETTVPPASAPPPGISTAPATAPSPSPAAGPAPAPATASVPDTAAPRSPQPAPPSPSTNTAPVAAVPTATIQDLNRQVDAFVGDGTLKYQHGDLAGALAAFNQALNLNPKSAPALYNRGLTKAAQTDLDGAMADYSQALQNDPNMAAAYYYRGLARHSKADLDGALSDYNQAVQLDPKNALAYFNRGLIRMQRDDVDGAIVDSTRALELDPHLIQSYYDRGLGRLAKGALDGSLSDMKTFCQLAPQDGFTDYARLYVWLIESQQGHLAEASQDLSKSMNSGWNGAADSMVTRIGEYLLGQIPEAELVKSSASDIPVKDQGQRCEVWYFIGMRHLQAGDKLGAADDLRKCIGTQKTDYCEFILAQEALKNIGAPGASPTTLPVPRAQAVTLPDPGTMGAPTAAASDAPMAPAAK